MDAWFCKKCGATSQSPALDFPMMHPMIKGPDHVVEPALGAVAAWRGLI